MQFKCKYAIFDNDGTLLESMYYWRLGALEFLLAHRLPIPDEMTLGELFSFSSRKFTQMLMETGDFEPQAVIAEMEARMERHYLFDVNEKPGVGAFLDGLAQAGTRMCVCTAAPRELCAKALERFGLRERFAFVTDSYEINLDKGEADCFRAVAARLGARPQDCWVFEDSLYAMRAAKEAGMRVCAVAEYTQRHHRQEILELADAWIEDYRQQPRMLKDA